MKNSIIIMITIAIMILVNGCASHVIYVHKPPPAKIVEIRPVNPHQHMVWIEGHWEWNVKHQKYIWIKGHWIKRKSNRAWIPGRWKQTNRGWIWIRGHWK